MIRAEDLRSCGSRGLTLIGRNAFKNYVEETRAAFPDWHNQIDEMLTVGDLKGAIIRVTSQAAR